MYIYKYIYIYIYGICAALKVIANEDPRTDPRRLHKMVRRWTKVQGDGVLIWSFANEDKNYDPEGEAMCGKRTIPRLPLVLAHVRPKVIEGEMTAWEVVMLMKNIIKESLTELQNFFKPTLTWAL